MEVLALQIKDLTQCLEAVVIRRDPYGYYTASSAFLDYEEDMRAGGETPQEAVQGLWEMTFENK